MHAHAIEFVRCSHTRHMELECSALSHHPHYSLLSTRHNANIMFTNAGQDAGRGSGCSFRRPDTAQERGNVAFVVLNGELEGTAAITATERVSCTTRQRCTGNTAALGLRGHVCVGRDEELANVHVTYPRRLMQRGSSTEKR